MSIADHFHNAPDATFVRDYDGRSARRQFNLSVVLMLTLALAAAALSALVRFESAGSAGPTAAMSAPPTFAGKL